MDLLAGSFVGSLESQMISSSASGRGQALHLGGLPVCFPPDLLLFIQKLSSEAQTLVSSLDLASFQHPSTIQTGCCANPVISQSRDLCIPKTQGQTDLRGDDKHQNHCCTSISLAATSHYCYSRTCLRVIRHMHKCHVMQTHG